jgi:hypothetical protein
MISVTHRDSSYAAKPRKRYDFRHPTDGLYAAKHEARLSNISGKLSMQGQEQNQRSFVVFATQDDNLK